LSEDGYIEGAPELIAEISASSAAIDVRDKKRAYRRNGVQEYIIWQVFERQVDWFTLQEGEYVSLVADDRGIIRSQVFPGLWLDTLALLNGEMQQVLATLQTGLSSLEHQAFVNLLGDRSP
jgi:Uma2 family endonuclease